MSSGKVILFCLLCQILGFVIMTLYYVILICIDIFVCLKGCFKGLVVVADFGMSFMTLYLYCLNLY